MSTRANIIITDGEDQLIFYRHSDGYPSGVKLTLTRFLNLVKTGAIRDNLSQAAGWLIILGREEYDEDKVSCLPGMSWKVGAYEPTTCIHGDIEYLYEIDLKAKTLRGWAYDCRNERKLEEVEI